MAGSLRKFGYTSDDGTVYNINRDESNTEIVNISDDNEGGLPPNGTASLPQGYVTRYALLYLVADPQIKRKVTILDPTVFAALNGGTNYEMAIVGAANGTFRISSLIGERREGLTNKDTGQNDGDNEIANT